MISEFECFANPIMSKMIYPIYTRLKIMPRRKRFSLRKQVKESPNLELLHSAPAFRAQSRINRINLRNKMYLPEEADAHLDS